VALRLSGVSVEFSGQFTIVPGRESWGRPVYKSEQLYLFFFGERWLVGPGQAIETNTGALMYAEDVAPSPDGITAPWLKFAAIEAPFMFGAGDSPPFDFGVGPASSSTTRSTIAIATSALSTSAGSPGANSPFVFRFAPAPAPVQQPPPAPAHCVGARCPGHDVGEMLLQGNCKWCFDHIKWLHKADWGKMLGEYGYRAHAATAACAQQELVPATPVPAVAHECGFDAPPLTTSSPPNRTPPAKKQCALSTGAGISPEAKPFVFRFDVPPLTTSSLPAGSVRNGTSPPTGIARFAMSSVATALSSIVGRLSFAKEEEGKGGE
jgi:hypothetical protein